MLLPVESFVIRFRGLLSRSGTAPRRPGARMMEELENRLLLATYTVINLNDAGAGSLRDAVAGANGAAGADVIEFDAAVRGTITLTTGQLTITDDLAVNGPGADQLAIANGGGFSRIFGFFAASASLSGVSITGGSLAAGVLAGAGLVNSGTLTLTSVTVSSNSAGSNGGGLYNEGTLTIVGSTFSGNSAGAAGGGIHNIGTLTILNSTFWENQAADGGGVYSTDTLTVRNSTIASSTGGRGVSIAGGSGVVVSTIISGNAGGDVSGTFAGGSINNLVQDFANAGGLINGVNANLVGADPLLVTLGYNGGATMTTALNAGSPAIGKGVNPGGLTTDQRGGLFARGATVDIGAYQRQTLALVVGTTVDEADADYSAGDLSLREAIAAAGPNPGNDTITFGPAVINKTLTLGGSELLITGDLTINGPGADRLTIQGNMLSRVFHFASGTSFLSGVSVRTGYTGFTGGGILNAGTLTITNSIIDANESDGEGGGIHNAGTLVISASTVSANNSSSAGGGISNDGSLTISTSTIAENFGNLGGGIHSSGSFVLSNSTVGQNTAGTGGGILDSGTATVVNSTIAGNLGEGIRFTGSFTVRSSIIAGNSVGDVFGSFEAGSTNNLVQGLTFSGGLTSGVNGNLVGVNPDLGTLAFNGGLTRTMALPLGSPAIGKGINPSGFFTDQRGGIFGRGAAVDIGAYQRQLFNLVVDTLSDVNDGNYSAGNLSLREAITVGPNPGNDMISFGPALSTGTIRLTGGQLEITGDLTITGPGSGRLRISGENASTVFRFRSGTSFIIGLTISGGLSTGDGGGVRNDGTLTITNSTISGNTAQKGGGIANSGTMTITGSTISGNTAANGGGIYNSEGLTIINSTISGNSSGSAVENAKSGDAAIYNSTIAGNVDGYGIRNEGSAKLVSTIVSGHIDGDISGSLAGDSINNLVQSVGSYDGGLNDNVNGNIVGFDPLLGGLASNGGPTQTMALLSGSPAINKGINQGGVTTDQRGAGFARPRGTAVDIGAFEFSAVPTIGSLSLSVTSITRGQSLTLTAGTVVDADGTILRVNFYYDANKDGAADETELIGIDSSSDGGYTLVFSQTQQLAGGIVTLLAVALDNESQAGDPASAQLTVANAAPTLNTFTVGSASFAQGDPFELGATLTDDGSIASVSYYADSNNNGVPDAGELLGVADAFANYSLTLNAAQTNALPLGLVNFIARATDSDGLASNVLAASATALFGVHAGDGRLVSGTADAADESRVVTVNPSGHVIVFEAGWAVYNLQVLTGAPVATGDAVIWMDPKDNGIYVAAPSADGLLLFARTGDGAWTFRNLTIETGATSSPTHGLAQITSVNNIVALAGLDGDGRIVGFQQTLSEAPGGGPAFKFIDISADLASQGMATPQLTSLIGYVTTWDAWNLAGIDATGKIQVVWVVPATFTTWRTDDLSGITGAPAAQGQLTVTLTGWGGINLAALNAEGSLLTTWWVPSFEGVWQVSDLTAMFTGTPLSGGKVSGYTTPWGGLNYVGLAGDGTVMVYWWSPGLTDWNVSPLLPDSIASDQRPTGTLTSSSSAAGTLNVYGTSATGDVLRMWWQPSGENVWAVDNLSTVAGRG